MINTAIDGSWALRIYGSNMELPTNYEVCAGLGAAGVLFVVLSLFGSFVRGKFQDAAELARGPSHEDLDRAVGRAAQYDNVGALELLLDAGADLRDETSPAEHRGCVLGAVGPEFVKLALDRGVGPDSCADSESLIWTVVSGQQDDANTAKIVTLLAAAGWSTTATPEYSEDPPALVAERNQKPETVAALGRASASTHE